MRGLGEQWEGPSLDLPELNLVPKSQARALGTHILYPRRQNPAHTTFCLDTQDSFTRPDTFPLAWVQRAAASLGRVYLGLRLDTCSPLPRHPLVGMFILQLREEAET